MEDWSKLRIKPKLPQDVGLPIPPHQPPITRVARLLRTESLPIFYKTWRFPLVIHPKLDNRSQDPTTVVDWYEHIDLDNLALIKHVELYICTEDDFIRPRNAFIFYIDFHQKGNKVHFYPLLLPPKIFGGIPPSQQRVEDLHSRLVVKISSAGDELGPNGITTVGDLYRLVPDMEDTEELMGYV